MLIRCTSSPVLLVLLVLLGLAQLQEAASPTCTDISLPSSLTGSINLGTTVFLATGDVDGDGRVDVGVPAQIAFSDGGGSFTLYANPTSMPVGYDMVIAKVNNDDYDDIIGFSAYLNEFGFWESNGPARTLKDPVGIGSVAVHGAAGDWTVADLNHDGFPDLVVTAGDFLPAQTTFVFQTSFGTWGTPQIIFDAKRAYPSVALDVDGDGLDEVFAASDEDGSLYRYYQSSPGVMALNETISRFGGSSRSATLFDVNGDGTKDIVVLSESGPHDGFLHIGSELVHFSFNSPNCDISGGTMFDIDGDSAPDFFGMDYGYLRFQAGLQPDPSTYGVGSCDAQFVGSDGRDALVVDINADGWPDLLTHKRTANQVNFEPGFVIPDFTGSPTFLGTSPAIAYAIGDANQDMALDVLIVDIDGTLFLQLNNGGGSFDSGPVVLAASGFSTVNTTTLAFVDLNLDAALDVVIAPTTSNVVYWFAATGPGTYSASPVALLTSAAHTTLASVVPTSLDGNGWIDIALAGSGGVSVFLATAPATYGPETVIYATASARDLLATDLDGDGVIDLAFFAPGPGVLTKVLFSAATPGTHAAPDTVAFALDASLSSLAAVRLAGSSGPVSLVWRVDSSSSLFAAALDTHVVTTPMTFSSQPAAFAAIDVEANGRGHVVWASETVEALSWIANSHFTGLADASTERLVSAVSVAAVSHITVVDLAGDGYYGVVYMSKTMGLMYVHPFGPKFLSKRLSAAHLHFNHPECGGVQGTMSCLNAALARATPCFPAYSVLHVPAHVSRFVGCSTADDAPAVRARALVKLASGHPGTLTFDCQANGGGALWRIAPAGELAFEARVVVAGASASPGPASHAPIVVEGSLWLGRGAVFVGNSRIAPPNVLQINYGVGGAIFIADAAKVTLKDAVFEDNSAATHGGAIAGNGAVGLTMTNVTFRANTAANSGGAIYLTSLSALSDPWASITFDGNVAEGGDGGAFFIFGETSTLLLSSGVLVNNQAPLGAGGAVALGGPATLTVTVSGSGSRIADNLARFGGSFSLSVSPSLLSGTSMWSLRVDDTAGPSLTTSALLGNSTAAYGGLAYLCGGTVNFAGAIPASATAGATATVAGGTIYECPGNGFTSLVPNSLYGSVLGPGGYGTVRATPPTRMEMALADRVVSVPSGSAFGPRSVVLYDAHNEQVTDVSLALSLSPPAGYQISAVSYDMSAVSLVVPLDNAALLAISWPDGLNVPITVPVVPATAPAWAVDAIPLNVTLTACPAGFGRLSGDSSPLTCSACVPGTFSANMSTLPCEFQVVCGPNAVAYNGQCFECAANTFRPASNDTDNTGLTPPDPCECIPGFWTPQGIRDTACLPCPAGAVCDGALARPVALPGWYPVSGTADGVEFTRCPISGACTGGLSCSSEYAPGSYLCKDCAFDYFRTPDRTCDQCPPSSVYLFVLLIVLIVIAAVAGVAIVVFTALSIEAGGGLSREKAIPHAVTVGVLFLQVLGVLAQAPFGWPEPPVQQALDVANVANVQLSFFATDCTITDFRGQYALSVGLPFVLIIFILLFVGLLRVWPRLIILCCVKRPLRQVQVLAFLERLLFTFGPLLYIPLSRATLVFFDCTKMPDGNYYLDAELSIRCFSAEWFEVLPVALAAFVVYVAFMPAFFALRVFLARNRLEDPVVLLRLGPIYHLYLRRFYYYEVVLLIKRLGIVSGALFFSSIPVLLFGSLFFLFVAATVFQLAYRPFHNPLHNSLENTLNVAILVLIVCGMMFWTDAFPDTFSFSIVVAIAIGVILYAIGYIILVGLREALYKRRTRTVVRSTDAGPAAVSAHDRALVSHMAVHYPDVDAPWLQSSIGSIVNHSQSAKLEPATELMLDALSWSGDDGDDNDNDNDVANGLGPRPRTLGPTKLDSFSNLSSDSCSDSASSYEEISRPSRSSISRRSHRSRRNTRSYRR